MRFTAILVLASLLLIEYSNAIFYLPGVAPRQFLDGQDVEMSVNKLTSVRTQFPYEYYSLPVCKPDVIVDKAENLGELLSGDRIENSLYQLKMKVKEECQILCRKVYSEKEVSKFKKMIKEEYKVHWIIDNLPASMRLYDREHPDAEHFDSSFPLGVRVETDKKSVSYYLYNHISFTILFHENPSQFIGSRVVGFIVEPFSVKHEYEGTWPAPLKSCNSNKRVEHFDAPQALLSSDLEVVWTYDVNWVPSDIPWASRWDVFLKPPPDAQIHWFSIVNSLMIVLFLTGMVALIMLRTLNRDITRYNDFTEEETLEETGWKLVHGDIFRPPRNPLLLAIFCGTGVQIFAMTLTIMMFAVLGFLSPAKRGGLATATLLLFVVMGYPAGLVSSRLYKMFGLKNWKRCTIAIATMYPGTVFSLFFLVDLVEWANESSGAVPFTTLVALFVLWFGISVPLCSIGSYRGFKMKTISNPTRYNHIPRQVPSQPLFMHPGVSVLVGGLLPFGAVFIELFFIMSSIWLHQIYYLFGFLVVVLAILIVTCAEITIVLCYFQLCAEDYNWWWRSFLSSGASAGYLFLYSIMYFFTKLNITKLGAALLYFVYMFIISLSFFLLTGMIGFFACFWFVRQIYGAIKID